MRLLRGAGRVPLCVLVLGLLIEAPIGAAPIEVSSVEMLKTAIDRAAPGDRIVVADGVYTNTEPISISQQGTAALPIVISAQSIGGVEIRGTAGFTFTRSAAYVVVQGFRFTHAAGTMELPAGTHHCRITRNVFQLSVSERGAYLTVSGDDHQIDHNTFRDKNTEGQMLQVQGPPAPTMAQRTWIHHNYFCNFANSGRNNSSALHIGHSSRSLTSAHSLVEHNLFVGTRGENEGAVCNKSCDNTYRFNTFGEGCTELSLRHGNRCLVYGNFFIGTHGGLRFYGDDHKIFSNYFEGNDPALNIGNGDANVPPGQLTSHDRPDRVQVVFNTLVGNTTDVVMSGRSNGLGATGLVFANNIIQGGGRAVAIGGPLSDALWQGNILWENAEGPGDIPVRGYTRIDPQCKQDATGVYRLQTGSPVIGKAAGSYPYVVTDMDGQDRGSTFDPGADQFSIVPIANRRLTPADVGPDAPDPNSVSR
jgi:poly(beta-D-mannuronate) lyase